MKVLLVWIAGILSVAEAGLVPAPVNETSSQGEFVLKPGAFAAVSYDEAELFLGVLREAGAGTVLAPADVGSAIQFLGVDSLPDQYPEPTGEGYVMRITPEVINIHAATAAGRFYGLQTLAQLIEEAPRGADGSVRIACRDIIDAPRFRWRGYMLDESRHFTGVEGVKRLIDGMARYKLNRLHWHLTDSAGWRIEIRKYPRLTAVGGRGNETDRRPDAPVQFYTQDEIRAIVAYAKARAVVVVPEIDMPGHADAAVKAYPEHGGGGYRSKTDPNKWPEFTFNPAKPATLAFLDDILAEVAGLFPDAGVIHFGGDEVHFGWQKWPQLPEVRDLMQREGFKDLAEVEAWFDRRMAGTIRKLGFKAGGGTRSPRGACRPTRRSSGGGAMTNPRSSSARWRMATRWCSRRGGHAISISSSTTATRSAGAGVASTRCRMFMRFLSRSGSPPIRKPRCSASRPACGPRPRSPGNGAISSRGRVSSRWLRRRGRPRQGRITHRLNNDCGPSWAGSSAEASGFTILSPTARKSVTRVASRTTTSTRSEVGQREARFPCLIGTGWCHHAVPAMTGRLWFSTCGSGFDRANPQRRFLPPVGLRRTGLGGESSSSAV